MKKVTIQDVEPLIESTRGNVAAIARSLGVNRSTIWNRCNESPTLMQSLSDAREAMLDNAESMLYKKVLEGSTVELLFFLKTQGRNRGYVERQEVTGANGGSIRTEINHVIDPITATTIFDVLAAAGVFQPAVSDAKDDEIHTA